MTESKYVTATYTAKEALWLCSLIAQLFSIMLNAMTLFSDNQSAIALTKEHQYHTCMKHINIRFHSICWVIKDGKLHLIYCPTEEMVPDIFKKALPLTKVKHFTRELSLVQNLANPGLTQTKPEVQVQAAHSTEPNLRSRSRFRFSGLLKLNLGSKPGAPSA